MTLNVNPKSVFNVFIGAIIPYNGGEHKVKVSVTTIPGLQFLNTVS